MTQDELEPRYLDLIERNQGRIDRLCRAWSRTRADFEDLRSEILLQPYAEELNGLLDAIRSEAEVDNQ